MDGGAGNGIFMVVVLLLFMVLFIMATRKAKGQRQRQEAEYKALQDSLKPGDRVMLSCGIFGTIVDLGEKQLVLEIAPDVDIAVLREVVMKTVDPDEEDFEAVAVADDNLAENSEAKTEADLSVTGQLSAEVETLLAENEDK